MLFINNWSVYRSLLNIFKRLIIDLRGSSSRRKRGGWGNIDGRSRLEGFCRDTIREEVTSDTEGVNGDGFTDGINVARGHVRLQGGLEKHSMAHVGYRVDRCRM
jgi:hypothetical protein